MLRIRLTRVGKTNSPRYRVVVADHRKAVKGKFIEILGHYNPTAKPSEIIIDKERAIFWMERGAQASDTVNNLMCDLGILEKDNKIEKKFSKKFTKKQIKSGATDEKPAEAEVEKKAEAEETIETPEVAEEIVEAPEETSEVTEEVEKETTPEETK